MNQELCSLFLADQEDRREHDVFAVHGLRERDTVRRRRVAEMLAQGLVTAPEDYYHAALIFQHGETVEEIWQAHELAGRAVELANANAMDTAASRWLVAASLDRWLMYQGKPQKYGTQFTADSRGWRLWDIDPTTTDDERAANHVPSLREQLRQVEVLNQTNTAIGSLTRPVPIISPAQE